MSSNEEKKKKILMTDHFINYKSSVLDLIQANESPLPLGHFRGCTNLPLLREKKVQTR